MQFSILVCPTTICIIIIIIIIVGARGPRRDMKSCHIIVRMSQSTDQSRKGARGEEEMSQSTLWHCKWEQEFEERERERISDHRENF